MAAAVPVGGVFCEACGCAVRCARCGSDCEASFEVEDERLAHGVYTAIQVSTIAATATRIDMMSMTDNRDPPRTFLRFESIEGNLERGLDGSRFKIFPPKGIPSGRICGMSGRPVREESRWNDGCALVLGYASCGCSAC